MKKKSVHYLVQAALIAALYAVLTILQNVLIPNSATLAVQFRASEALTMLALFTPAAIPGLFVGCILANISSVAALGPLDMIFGSLASLAAAFIMYKTRNLRIKGIPFLAALMPALVNGLVIGFEIEYFFVEGGFHFGDFLLQGALVALGELAVVFVLGIPLMKMIEKTGLDKRLFVKE
ncbi:MAG: QueT transporter family protein [bacterium]|nr:QueT transporter family protein [bacterium]MDD6225240.1 QueT transporter family protein [bacterium]MDY3861330.1 QueT transporter family protein [Ruminococcus sp.]